MFHRISLAAVAALLALPASAATPCEPVAPDPVKNLPSFCRATATLKPSADSEIRIEVWLPAPANWNGNLQSVGNGAWAGTINYTAMGAALAAGYAAAGTDTGHQGNNSGFILNHPDKLIDFAYRAVHETTVAAKAIVAGYYGKGPKFSYWNGCSTGGRQAMAEAQHYPLDYDGIVAGAPASYVTHLQGAQLYFWQVANADEASFIPPAKYPLIHTAALEACDALDGVKDGVIEDPTRCHFDPRSLVCKEGDSNDCLTSAQAAAVAGIYAGPAGVFPGFEPGSELGWGGYAGRAPNSFAADMYKFVVFHDPSWDVHRFDVTRDVQLADKAVGQTMNSVDPNLAPFFAHGGKLLQYHGWSDPAIPPQSSVNYYKSVTAALGAGKVAGSYRLFMVPGMGHCRGGEGADTFDPVAMLARWVEQGKAPERIEASRIKDGQVERTHPLCPFPQVARYLGSGPAGDARNFACKLP